MSTASSHRKASAIVAAILALAAIVSLSVPVSGPITPSPRTGEAPSFQIHPLGNGTSNNTGNNTCAPGSYCYGQLTNLVNWLYPWYGQTGSAISFLMERVLLLTYLIVAMAVFIPAQAIILFYYFRRRFEEVRKYKIGPTDPANWELLWTLFEYAVPEEHRPEMREKLRKLAQETAKKEIAGSLRRLRAEAGRET